MGISRGQTRQIARAAILDRADLHRVSAVGDSITAPTNGDTGRGTTWFPQFVALGQRRVWYVGNYAVTGKTSLDVLNDQVPSAVADASEFVVVLCGTNDSKSASGVTTDPIQFTLAQSKTNITAICTAIVNAGKIPLLCTIPPLSWQNVATWKARAEDLDAWLRSFADANGYPLIDMYDALVDRSNGNLTAAYTSDNLHPNTTGARVMANRAITDALGRFSSVPQYLASSNTDRFNLLPNGLFLTDGNADGLADSWTLVGTKAFVTPTLTTIAGLPGNAQVLTWSANELDYLNRVVSTGFSVGDRTRFAGRFWTSGNVSGGLHFTPSVVLTGASQTIFPLWSSSLAFDMDDGWWSVDFTVPAGTTSLDVRLAGSGGSGVVKLGQVTLINLTTSGIS